MPSKVQLQVEVVEKNAEARLKALDKLAQEMGNRKITLNFDEASLAKWKTATDGMTNAQLSAYAKLVTASENASAKIIAAGERTTQEEMKQNTKLITERQKSIDKKIALYEKEDTKRRQAAEKTAQTEINANAKVEAAALKGANATRTQTTAQKELNTEASKTSGIFDSITQRFTAANLVSSLITAGISRLRSAVREAVTELKEMDKELTTIKMVSGASDSYIGQLTNQAFAGARANGRSVTDYLSAAEMFTRAGYRNNIDQLSQLSLMTQNIGGVEEETAAKFLLAADAAWKLGGSYDSLMGVLDGVSAVADQNATDLGKIAEGITIAGSAMANAGVSAQQFTAMLGVTTASTQRSGSEMARGLRTILFRVRQVKKEFEDGEVVDADAISKAAGALKEVAQIDVFDKNGHLRDFMDIMNELADKWPELSKFPEKIARLQDALAGSRNGNVLFALMGNWEHYEKMLQQYEESSGTALEKNAIYTDSWAAATNNLNTAWTNLFSTLTGKGGVLKWFTEELTAFLDATNGVFSFLQNPDAATSSDVWERILTEFETHPEKYKGIFGIDRAIGTIFREMTKGVAEDDSISSILDEVNGKIKETDGEVKKYTDAANEASGANGNLAGSAKKAATAFEKQRNVISEVAKAIKEEKDDAVNSLSDIYKSMNEAAENGMWGSNAFRKGGALFFSEDVLNDIRSGRKNPLKDAMDAYFKGIEDGDYADASAKLFSNITKGANEIKDEISGEALVSMKDLGDSFEWTFDKGSRSMDEYLQSLQNSSGLSKTFWASMIESLGMYSDELAAWTEENGEVKTEAEVETDEATSTLNAYKELLNSVPKSITTVVTTVYRAGGSATAAETAVKGAYANQYGSAANPGYTWSYAKDAPASAFIPPKAGGKHDNYSGIALVNDEFPADGSKPELIISGSTGRAYIANGGKPALVNLASNDTVLTAAETKSALGIPGFDEGKSGKVTATIKKGSGSKSSGGGSSEEKADATESWNQLKKLVDYMMDKEKDILDDKLDILDKQLAELEAARKSQKNIDTLAQKLVAVDEAQLDLLKAETERTVRYYNESTKQWEWMADQGALAQAEEAYQNALKDLNDFLTDLDFEEQKANIQAQKDALQEAFDTYKEGWDLIIDSIEAPTGDLVELFNDLKTNGTEAMKSQTENIETLLDALEQGFYSGIEDNTLASQTALESMYNTLDKATQDSMSIAQNAINNILERSGSAVDLFSTNSTTSMDELMARAKDAVASMSEDASDATTTITGAASDAILDIVQSAKDFLNGVKETDTSEAAESEDSSGGSGGGDDKKGKDGGKGKTVLATTNSTQGSVSTGGLHGSTIAYGAKANLNTGNLKLASTAMNNSTVNNNGGNTYMNGVRIGNDQLDSPLRSVLKGLSVMKAN